MPTKTSNGRKFDARPDRIDYRDRLYRPPLVSLPSAFPNPDVVEAYLPAYCRAGLILDQGHEGACTGFGLAAAINYLHWRQALGAAAEQGEPLDAISVMRVSPRMLYHLARVYDEWAGEDYEGSSCRGAMKGWHRHGVCAEKLWRSSNSRKYRPNKEWVQDAAQRPLGAYYRIKKESILDMQAAIHEVGAVYVSADVHDGWDIDKTAKLPIIKNAKKSSGGHAFCLVGYNADGFIVQNSWGEDWGYHGFAVMTYDDWVQRGADAWGATMGAPVRGASVDRSFSSKSLQSVMDGRASWFWRRDQSRRAKSYQNPRVEPLEEGAAYRQMLVMGNDGRPLNRLINCPDAVEAVADVCFALPEQWLAQKSSNRRIAIYAHGGLNNEDASLRRVRLMAPYFLENDIYPIFLTWRTGFMESLTSALSDSFSAFSGIRAEGIGDVLENIANTLAEARDRTLEVACEHILVKGIWSQMKQNAEASAMKGHGLHLLCGHLAALKKKHSKLDIHLVGHSAGSILLGYLLKLMSGRKLKAKTCSLWAPACTLDFAVDHYGGAFKKKTLDKKAFHVDLLSDEREKADQVAVYGKSLLYLVSRALEQAHKTPLLGMEKAWRSNSGDQDLWHASAYGANGALARWRKIHGGSQTLWRVHDQKRAKVSNGRAMIDLAHGSFDNDLDVVTKMLARVRGSAVRTKVESLADFGS